MAVRNLRTTPVEHKNPPKDVKLLAKQEKELILQRPKYEGFDYWLVGDYPLICHAWSEKAKRDMFNKQTKRIDVKGRSARDPKQDFVDSLYDMGDGVFGFPVTAVKKAMRESAHQARGIPKVAVFPAVHFDALIVKTRTAFAGAVCALPLIPIVAGKPEMREDMGRIGSGLQRTSTLIYRGQFFPWALRLRGRVNVAAISLEGVGNLLEWAGLEVGIGEWRTEKSGIFGAFHVANAKEAVAWEAFADGRGKIPMHPSYSEVA